MRRGLFAEFFILYIVIEIPDFIYLGAHVCKEGICQGDSGHGFYNYNGSWDDDRVVAAVDFEGEWLLVFGDSTLWLADGWGWLDVGAENDFAAVADSAHNTACVVGGLDDFVVLDGKTIVVCGAV